VGNRARVAAYTTALVLHVTIVALLAEGPAHTRSRAAGSPSPTITLIHAEDVAEAPPAPLPRDQADGLPDAGDVAVDGLTFNVDKIARRRGALFPFISGDLPFEALETTLKPNARHGLENPLRAHCDPELPPLRLRDDAIQRLVDRSWSRRDRWNSFAPIRRLDSRCSPPSSSWHQKGIEPATRDICRARFRRGRGSGRAPDRHGARGGAGTLVALLD